MMYDEERRALICYAGSAPEASISSKPLGSELFTSIGMRPLQCQKSSPYTSGGGRRPDQGMTPQPYDNVMNNLTSRLRQVAA